MADFLTPTLNADESLQRQAMGGLQMEEKGLDIQQKKLQVQQQQQMMKLAQGLGSDTDPISKLYALANGAANAGMPELAATLVSKASTAEKNIATAGEAATKSRIQKLTMLSSVAGSVHDQASLDAANFFIDSTGIEIPPSVRQALHAPYDALDQTGILDKIRTGLTTQKDRALTDAAKARTSLAAVTEKREKAQTTLDEARTRLTDARTDALGKTGGRVPAASDVRMATDLIGDKYDAGGPNSAVSPEETRNAARDIVTNADKLVKKLGLTRPQAIKRAYADEEAAGRFAGYPLKSKALGTRGNPTNLPLDKAGKIDRGKLTEDQIYWGKPGTPYEGQAWQFDKKKGRLVSLVGSPVGEDEPGVSGEDDEGDEE